MTSLVVLYMTQALLLPGGVEHVAGIESISAQVGQLYPPGEESQRTRGYAIFSMGINVGAVVGPLLCGLLAQLYGWHVGFGFAGLLMLLAIVTYLAGARHLPDARPAGGHRAERKRLTPAERRIVLLLMAVLAITIFQSVAYYQLFNVGLVWLEAHVNVATPLGPVPIPWFNSIDAFFSIIGVPPLITLWRHQAQRGHEPGDLAKIGIGAALMAGSALLMALAGHLAGSGRTGVVLPFLAFALSGIAFLYYWPTLLALVSRASPQAIVSTMMGTAFLTLFLGNSIMGQVGGFYESLGPAKFWLLDAAISAAGALIILAVNRPLSRELAGAAATRR